MKRWFIARMGDYDGEGTRVPATNKYLCDTRIWSNPAYGFCLGQLGTKDLSPIRADPDIKIIPDASLDNLLTSIPANVRSAMIVNLTDGGFDVSAVKGSWSIRQLLIHLKTQLQTGDNIEAGDVRDMG